MAAHPPLRPHGRADVWAPTGTESAAFDRRAIDEQGVPEPVLMENAGRSAALLTQKLFPEGPVVAFAGSGNNGGDAVVLARTLAAWGRPATLVLAGERDPEREALAHGWALDVVPDSALDEPDASARLLEGAGVIVDGILGTGIRGAPRERQRRAIDRLNEVDRPVLALDVPSGVDADTGAVGGTAVRASVTVAFGAPKLGTLLGPGREQVGRLIAVEIGFPPLAGAPSGGATVVTPAWAQARLPVRPSDTHKNAVGRVLVVAGRDGMAGAAVLSVRGAFRAGAGLVRVCSAPSNREILQTAAPEAIYVDPADAGAVDAAVDASDAVAVGPGLGTDPWAEELLRSASAAGTAPIVCDADALNLLAAGRGLDPNGLRGREALLTPHPGEMARLLGLDGPPGTIERVDAARNAAERFGCSVLLKGAPSIVAAVDGRLRVDSSGSSDLAVAGMGDLLTGVCAALAAQGLDAGAAGSVALYLTGRAAALAGRGRALTPSDVARRLPEALAERGPGATDLGMPFVIYDADPPR